MAEHAASGSASAGDITASSAFLSPVSKYNKLREEERLAQQERLKNVRVEHRSSTATGKRKLENGASESSSIATSTSPSVTFTDAPSSSSASRSATSSSSSSSSKAAVLTASLAKKKQRRSGSSAIRTSTESGSSGRRGSSDSKSISGIMKNYMKKVEAEKRDPAAGAASKLHAAHAKHHLTYDAMKQVLSTPPSAATASASATRATATSSSSSLQSPEMFSRAVDASFQRVSASSSSSALSSAQPKRVLKHFDSLAVAKNKLERQREAAEADSDYDDDPSSLHTPHSKFPKRAARLVTSVKDEDVVDLDRVADVSSLETVEGSEILAALRSTGTPRTGRTFPSERAQPASDERDRAFLQRRHLALRKKYTAVPDTDRARRDAQDDKWAYTESATGTIVIERKATAASSSASTGRAVRKLNVDGEGEGEGDDDPTPDASAAGDAQDDQSAPADSGSKPEDDSDRESTASKIARISAVRGASWRAVVLGLVASACVAVVAVVALPALALAFAPALPFCDSSERSAAVSVYAFDRSKALQPYTADATASASCRPCPVFGTCSDGALQSCLPPYERVESACVEDPDVQHDLQRLASVIHDFVVSKAASHMTNISLWTALVGGSDTDASSGAVARAATPVQILLSELQDVLASTIAYGKALAKLPRDYVFHRALDLALRDLHDIFVTDANELFVGPRAAPWAVRAKHTLYSYARVLVSLVAASLVSVYAYRHVQIRRLERSLVDRLVKEVRFALLQRTAKPDKWYPADYLRDDLFDILPDVTPQHRAWLRDTVWPRVMALVHDDSRVRSSTKTVSGEKMVVWEWVPVASPSKAPTTLAAAKQALVKLAGRRRTKASRKSFPM